MAPPGPGEVRLLIVDGERWRTEVNAAGSLLDPHESARAARFRFEVDRQAYVLAHAFLRLALAFCIGGEPRDVRLGRTAAGRPLLEGAELAISLSHSGFWVAVAMADAVTVGVDIEQCAPRPWLDEAIRTVATPRELRLIDGLPPQARSEATLALWTRKEAMLKALGTGFSLDPTCVETTDGEVSGLGPGVPGCTVRSFDVPEPLVGAWAAPVDVQLGGIHRLIGPKYPG